MGKKIRLADIAQKAGVTTATVSMALNNSDEISSATKHRIQRMAERMGYIPNPAARALSMSKSESGETSFLGTLAVLEEEEFATSSRLNVPQRIIWKKEMAEVCLAMGYKLDRFVVGSDEKDRRSIRRILQARGIKGLILEGHNKPVQDWIFDLNGFAVVAISSGIHEHFIHNVMSTSYQDIFDATEALLRRGYKRPGHFVVTSYMDHWPAGFESALKCCELEQEVPTLKLTGDLNQKNIQTKFLDWVSRYHPDVIVANEDERMLEILSRENIKVPRDMGFLCLDVWPARAALSGLIQLRRAAYQVAVDLLHSMLMRHEYGPPKVPTCIQIPCLWNEGTTLNQK